MPARGARLRPLGQSGFSLLETVFVAGILAFVIVTMIQAFIYSSMSSSIAGSKTLAVMAAQDMLEEIRAHTYDDIVADYASTGTPGNTFSPADLNGMGVVTVDASNAELLEITVAVCWEDKYGRIIGEDQNLNGILDSGEDLDGDGKIDSPVSLMTLLTKR